MSRPTELRKDPSRDDFFHDMNEHANARYKKIAPSVIAELEHHRGSYRRGNEQWRIVCWQAQRMEHRDTYICGDPGTYCWKGIAGTYFTERETAESTFGELTTKANRREFISNNPYTGPRG